MPFAFPSESAFAFAGILSRRLFDEPLLVGAKDQKPFGGLLLSNFEETRDDQFSLDRLGRTGVDKAVVRHLRPLADAAARTFHSAKRFDGWAVLSARRLVIPVKGVLLPLVASPENDNPYHAHLATQDLLASEPFRHYHIALHLKELFTGQGSSVYSVSLPPKTPFSRFSLSRLINWLKRFGKRNRSGL